MGCVQSCFGTDPDLQQLYTLNKCIGQGVEGEVYLATDNKTGQQVAIKLVARGPELGLGPEKVRREIQLQARLDHVNIVELKQVLLTRRHLAIVMSYEGGGDLHSYARKYKMNEEVARFFFRQIVEGVEYCHKSHIAHRDLKLSNFLLTTDKPMRVKLCDFGCARHWDTKHVPDKRIARFSTFAGTPAYMSPQVLQSAFYPTNTYNAVEADVWALGIVLCHLFFGAHTPFWLEPNAFRNEVHTMQARIEAMKQQNWVDSDEFVKANATALSPGLRDLLDKIFVADEFKRITVEGIKAHPWYTAELPPFLQQALDVMRVEQAERERLQRATVSLAANRHDTGVGGTGDFATIDLLVDLAQKHRKMPGGGDEGVFCLDMAHMELPRLSVTSGSTVDSHKALGGHIAAVTAASDAAAHAADQAAGTTTQPVAAAAAASASAAVPGHPVAANGSLYGPALHAAASSVITASTIDEQEATGEGTQHSGASTRTRDHSMRAGSRSVHFTSGVSGESPVEQALQGRFKKTLSLQRSQTGLVVGSYVLEGVTSSSTEPSSMTASVSKWLSSITPDGRAAQRSARSVHGGVAFFKEAADKADSSMHGGMQHSGAACASKTVHGGTAHAAAQGPNQPGGIFYQG